MDPEEQVQARVDLFLDEVVAVCLKYGLSLGLGDPENGFRIEPCDKLNFQWLRQAEVSVEAERILRDQVQEARMTDERLTTEAQRRAEVAAGLPDGLARLLRESLARHEEAARMQAAKSEVQRQERWKLLVGAALTVLPAELDLQPGPPPEDFRHDTKHWNLKLAYPGLAILQTGFDLQQLATEGQTQTSWLHDGRWKVRGGDTVYTFDTLTEALLCAFDHGADEELPF